MSLSNPKFHVSKEFIKKLHFFEPLVFVMFVISLASKAYKIPFATPFICVITLALFSFLKAFNFSPKLKELPSFEMAIFSYKLLNLAIATGYIYILFCFQESPRKTVFFYPFVISSLLSIVVIIHQKIGFKNIMCPIEWFQFLNLCAVIVFLLD